jgi:hypothetical protein
MTSDGKVTTEERVADPREVISDFMVEGHLRYEVVGRASDYDRTDAMIRDLAAEGITIIATSHIKAFVALARFAALRLPLADVNGPEMQRVAAALKALQAKGADQ